jgi:hypothetical protein
MDVPGTAIDSEGGEKRGGVGRKGGDRQTLKSLISEQKLI